MLDWLNHFWPLVLVVETVALVWSLVRPSPQIRWLLAGRPSAVRHSAGTPNKYWYSKLRRQPKGVIARIRVTGPEANVRIVDGPNFRRLKAGKRYAYVGGRFNASPIDLTVPWDGTWCVVADLGGEKGHLNFAVAWISGYLPKAISPPNSAPRLSKIKRLPEENPVVDEERDVFISYASEDREAVARPLADALAELDVSVWLDEYELRIGDSLRRKIDQAISQSRFGVIVLSPEFFTRGWPQQELSAFFTGQLSGVQVILPIWHRITKEELLRKSPLLVDKIALSTGQYTIAEIAREIAQVISDQDLWVSADVDAVND